MAGRTNRKHGRNKPFCTRYAAEGRREKNKAKRLHKRILKHPNDKTAVEAFNRLPPLAKRGWHIEGVTT